MLPFATVLTYLSADAEVYLSLHFAHQVTATGSDCAMVSDVLQSHLKQEVCTQREWRSPKATPP